MCGSTCAAQETQNTELEGGEGVMHGVYVVATGKLICYRMGPRG